MRASLRFAMVALIAVCELVMLIAMLYSYDVPIGQYGFIVGGDGITITAVEPDLPAALAGIKPGDRILYKSLPLLGRRILTLKEPVPAGTPLQFQIIHDGQTETVTLHAQTIPGTYVKLIAIVSALAGFALGVIGLILVLLRPSRMTWGFALIALPMLLPLNFLFYAQSSGSMLAIGYDFFVSIVYALQITGLLIFASRFPNDKPQGLAAIIDRLSIPAGVMNAAIYFYAIFLVRFTNMAIFDWLSISNYAILLPSLAALAALISTYATTHGSARSRLAPVIISFILLIGLGTLQQMAPEFTRNNAILFVIYFSYSAVPALVAAAVAYGVIRHRVMDVDFIIERTLVYSMLTVFVVAIFSAIEFIVGKLFEGRLADMMQMAAAVSVGVSINYVHGRLEHFLNIIFFRRRYAARRRLSKIAQTLPYASTLALIDEMLVVEPVEALDLASAAIFRRNGDCYTREAAHGWEKTITKLNEDDLLIVRLRTDLQPVKVSDVRWPLAGLPMGHARPIYAVPVIMGYHLEAVLLYGAHRTGEDLDSDEHKSLSGLARSAALAYSRLTQQQLQDNINVLKIENQTQQKIAEKLENLLKSRLEGQA